MPNKLLKTLTIDGVPMDNYHPVVYISIGSEDHAVATQSGVSSIWETGITIPKGYNIMSFTIIFDVNASGSRYAQPLLLENGSVYDALATARAGAAPTGTTVFGLARAYECPREMELGVRVFQNSGNWLTVRLACGIDNFTSLTRE